MLYIVPNVHQLLQIYIVFNIWKHHFAVNITFGALFGILDTSFLLRLLFFLGHHCEFTDTNIISVDAPQGSNFYNKPENPFQSYDLVKQN